MNKQIVCGAVNLRLCSASEASLGVGSGCVAVSGQQLSYYVDIVGLWRQSPKYKRK